MKHNFNWSDEQIAIFSYFESGKGNAIVRARAGSGKSTTIIEGLNRAKEDSCLYAVFNKLLQTEAVGKITNQKVDIRTMHSLGFSFILKNWRGVRADGFTEYNRIKNLCPDAPKQFFFLTSRLVSFLKNTIINPTLDDARKTAVARGFDSNGKLDAEGWTTEKICETALKSIQLSLDYPKDRKISFDDMLYIPLVKGWVEKQYKLICVDETQDLNLLQLTMAISSCIDGGRICLVGDDRQDCYFFRGSLPNGIDTFKEKLNAIEFPLNVTYRCPRKIVEMAQLIVPSIKPMPGAIDGIIESINLEKALSQAKPGDIFLSRINAPLVKHALSLIRKSVPSYVVGKDIGKGLLDIVNNLEANTVNGFLDNLQKWQDAQINKATGVFAGQRIELINDQAETLRVIAEGIIKFEDIEKKINSLFQDTDYVKVPSVIFSTVHKAKGKEFLNTNILSSTFKSGRRKLTPEEIVQEENLYYIALTRSKSRLSLIND